MPSVTLSQAAKLAGKSKATLSRAVASGKLSASRETPPSGMKGKGRGGPRAATLIDVAELERVYGPLKRPDVSEGVPMERSAMPWNEEDSDRLQARIVELEADRADLRHQLDEERAERARLVSVIEDQARTMRLLEDHRAPEAKRSWWRRIF